MYCRLLPSPYHNILKQITLINQQKKLWAHLQCVKWQACSFSAQICCFPYSAYFFLTVLLLYQHSSKNELRVAICLQHWDKPAKTRVFQLTTALILKRSFRKIVKVMDSINWHCYRILILYSAWLRTCLYISFH